MKQDGPFAVTDDVDIAHRFSREKRRWVRELTAVSSELTKYRAVRSQIFNLLDINRFSDIGQLLNDEVLRQVRSRRAGKLLGSLFQISLDADVINIKLHEYAQTADGVIKYLQNKLLSPYAADIEKRAMHECLRCEFFLHQEG